MTEQDKQIEEMMQEAQKLFIPPMLEGRDVPQGRTGVECHIENDRREKKYRENMDWLRDKLSQAKQAGRDETREEIAEWAKSSWFYQHDNDASPHSKQHVNGYNEALDDLLTHLNDNR